MKLANFAEIKEQIENILDALNKKANILELKKLAMITDEVQG